MARLVIAVTVVALLLAGCDDDDPAPTPTQPLATSVATLPVGVAAAGLDARSIVERSSAVMASVGPFVVDSRSWHHTRTDVTEPVYSTFYDGADQVVLWPETTECLRSTLPLAAFSDRELGALALYSPTMGATAPSFEYLGEETLDGQPVWRVRYRSNYPSDEGPYPVEWTEWVSRDDFRLLRAESQMFDPFGFVGITVLLFTDYGEPELACPRQPDGDDPSLTPRTDFRLESPR